ncbi:MAG: hypothetical protein P8Z75_13790 [Gammaproteobacteria bacterium]
MHAQTLFILVDKTLRRGLPIGRLHFVWFQTNQQATAKRRTAHVPTRIAIHVNGRFLRILRHLDSPIFSSLAKYSENLGIGFPGHTPTG